MRPEIVSMVIVVFGVIVPIFTSFCVIKNESMTRTSQYLFLSYILLSYFSGVFIVLGRPVLLYPCSGFSSVGPISTIFGLPAREYIFIQVTLLAGELTVLAYILINRYIQISVCLSPIYKNLIYYSYFTHCIFTLSVIVAGYYLLAPDDQILSKCLNALNMTLSDFGNYKVMTYDLSMTKTKILFYCAVYIVVGYYIFGFVASLFLVYKLKTSTSVKVISTQRRITTTTLVMGISHTALLLIPYVIMAFVNIFRIHVKNIADLSVVSIVFSHIVCPLSICFTLSPIRRITQNIIQSFKESFNCE